MFGRQDSVSSSSNADDEVSSQSGHEDTDPPGSRSPTRHHAAAGNRTPSSDSIQSRSRSRDVALHPDGSEFCGPPPPRRTASSSLSVVPRSASLDSSADIGGWSRIELTTPRTSAAEFEAVRKHTGAPAPGLFPLAELSKSKSANTPPVFANDAVVRTDSQLSTPSSFDSKRVSRVDSDILAPHSELHAVIVESADSDSEESSSEHEIESSFDGTALNSPHIRLDTQLNDSSPQSLSPSVEPLSRPRRWLGSLMRRVVALFGAFQLSFLT